MSERSLMQWMTMAWWRGDVPRDSANGYSEHFAALRDRLPENLRDFHDNVTLHDANVESFDVDLDARRATLILKGFAWEKDRLPDEPVRWTLAYDGVQSVRSIATSDAGLGGPAGYGDLGYDELHEVVPGLFEHRMVFSTSIELAITFRQLTTNKTSAS